jgi:hypothetical protein
MRCTWCSALIPENTAATVDDRGYFRRYCAFGCMAADMEDGCDVMAGSARSRYVPNTQKREPLIVQVPTTLMLVHKQVQEEKQDNLFLDLNDPDNHVTQEEFFAGAFKPL